MPMITCMGARSVAFSKGVAAATSEITRAGPGVLAARRAGLSSQLAPFACPAARTSREIHWAVA
eukprot:5545593-Alexandrium_andersonii.AAC.1